MKRPYTFMLVAVSLDGKISPRRRPGQPNPIGPSLIDADIMKLHNSQRANADGIMVGLNCILLDDSRLTLREGRPGHQLTRIVLDGLAEVPPTAKVLNRDAPTIMAVTEDAPIERVRAFQDAGAQIVTAGHGKYVDLVLLMNALYEQFGIRRLLVEGGGTVHQSMISAGLYDEIHLIICPFVIGGSASITPVERSSFWPKEKVPTFQLVKVDVLGDYLSVIYKPGPDTSCTLSATAECELPAT
ncbi:MAG: dihydrofolate reductase family protein [bacterium]